MKLWKVEIRAYPKFNMGHKNYYVYAGTATTAEIAIRQAKRAAKKDGLSQIVVEKTEYLGEKEFGK